MPGGGDKRGIGKGEQRNKVVSLAEAAALVRSGDTVCTSGFVGIGTPDDLLAGLERRFLDTGEPRNLTLLFAAGQGDGKEQGLNRLGHDGLLEARGRRALGADPQGRPAGDGEPDRGLQPAAGRDLAPLSRHRRRQARHLHQGRPAHLRRPAPVGRQGQRRHDRGPGPAGRVRRRGVAVLQGVPDPHRIDPRHHRRPRGQPEHGARGADAGQSGDGDGGQELGRAGDRAGRAGGRAAHAAPAHGQDPRASWWTRWWWPSPRTTTRPTPPSTRRPSRRNCGCRWARCRRCRWTSAS